MKKSEIIEEYNSLTDKLNLTINEYKKTTGKDWDASIKVGRMYPSMITSAKDDLEYELKKRKSSIQTIEEAIRVYVNKQRLLSTEEGRMFIKSYEDKKKELERRIDEIEKHLVQTFENRLASAGMGNWKIPVGRTEKILPDKGYSYFDIEPTDIKNVGVSITIDVDRKYEMSVSSSLHCGGKRDITTKDENYWQFKAYVAIHDFHQIFTDWMDNDYKKANIELKDIREEIEKVEKIIENPMSEYIVSKVGEKMTF